MKSSPIEEYALEVTRLIDTIPDVDELVERITPLKERLVADFGPIDELFFEGLKDAPYTRNRLYADPDHRFTVMLVVWCPDRQSPVHDHATWGVVGSVRGDMHIVDFYGPDEADPLAEKGRSVMSPGEVMCIVPPRHHNLHTMTNQAAKPAVTIHTYGDAATACRVYNPASGHAIDRELDFHN